MVSRILFFLVLLGATSMASARTYLYVANQGDNTVSVIDAAHDKVIKVISGIKSPVNIAASPQGKYVLVSSEPDTVTFISTATNTIVAKVPLNGYSHGVQFSSDGKRAYVARCVGTLDRCKHSVVSVIDVKTFSVISEWPIPGSDTPGIVVGPDGRFIYISNDSAIFVISATTGKVLKTLHACCSGSMGMKVDAKKGRIYFAGSSTLNPNNEFSELLTLNATTNTIESVVPLDIDPVGMAVNSDEGRLYFTHCNESPDVCEGGFLSIYDTVTNRITKTIYMGDGTYPFGVTWSGVRGHIYVANDNDPGTVTVVNAHTNSITGYISVGTTPFGIVTVSIP